MPLPFFFKERLERAGEDDIVSRNQFSVAILGRIISHQKVIHLNRIWKLGCERRYAYRTHFPILIPIPSGGFSIRNSVLVLWNELF